MKRHRNLFICEEEHNAKSLLRVLGLDERVWLGIGLNGMLTGERFERVVVYISQSASEDDNVKRYMKERVSTYFIRPPYNIEYIK